ncbi:MAG: ABC transporter substrate-binding protein [Actinomycetota bacterium]|nr:ABC transporter substrate-binding protein [Actinomycetota bacterium]
MSRPTDRALKRQPRHTGFRLQRTVAVAVVLVLSSIAAACGGTGHTSSSAKLDKVTVVLDWTPNTNHSGIYLARARGWYRRAGLDVNVIEPGDTPSLEILGAGKADVAISVQEELVPARAKGLPVVSIGAVIQHNTSSLLSLRSSGIVGPGDLPGHTYGGFGGLLEKALIKKFASCGGGDPAKVRFVDVGNADYRIGLQRHQYDVVWIFDGWDGIRLADVDKLAVNRIPFNAHTNCIPDWYTPLVATSESMIHTRPDVLKRFMAATSRGYQAAMRDPGAAAAALMEAAPELDRNLVERSARYLATRYAADPARWGHQDRQVWTRFVAFLRESGLIDRPIDVDQAFTNRFLPNR